MTIYICPDWPEDGATVEITGCGRTIETVPDDEGIIDCPHCGIWFSPTHPSYLNRTASA